MSYVVGAVVGVAAGLACVFLVGGVAGIVAGVVVAVLLYFGVGRLLAPEVKLGDVAASMVPDGEAAAGRVFEARSLADKVEQLGRRARSADVRAETSELAADVRKLAYYVEHQPATYRRLSHFLSTYGEQCTTVLENYLAVEVAAGASAAGASAVARGSRTGGAVARRSQAGSGSTGERAHADVIDALNALEGAAQGELRRAMGAKVAELSADSDAVRRLMELDGYTSDEREVDSAPATSVSADVLASTAAPTDAVPAGTAPASASVSPASSASAKGDDAHV